MTILPTWRRDYRIIQGGIDPIPSFAPVLWYDFSDESTVAVASSQITSVTDKGSRGWNLSKSPTGPAYVTGINGLKCVDWGSPGHNNYLRNSSATSTIMGEVYIVLDANFGSIFPNYNGLISGSNSGNWFLTGNFNTKGFYSDATPNFGRAYLNSSFIDVYPTFVLTGINSPCVLIVNRATGAVTTTTGFQIGNDRGIANRGWGGLIGEVVVFSSALSSLNRAAVLNHLHRKWGITTDPYSGYVPLLLHMDGANNSTEFVNSSPVPLTITANGNARISTTQSKFGGSSGAFDGSGDFVRIAYSPEIDLLGSDSTAECWVYFSAFQPNFTRIMGSGGGAVAWNTTNGLHWILTTDSANRLNFQVKNSSGVGSVLTAAAIPLATWTHISVSVSGSTAYLSIDGAVVSGSIGTVSRPSSNPFLDLATLPGEAAANNGLNGFIEDLRITKGIARYTSNFTPPIAPFPDS